jgi:hypothetical protein
MRKTICASVATVGFMLIGLSEGAVREATLSGLWASDAVASRDQFFRTGEFVAPPCYPSPQRQPLPPREAYVTRLDLDKKGRVSGAVRIVSVGAAKARRSSPADGPVFDASCFAVDVEVQKVEGGTGTGSTVQFQTNRKVGSVKVRVEWRAELVGADLMQLSRKAAGNVVGADTMVLRRVVNRK